METESDNIKKKQNNTKSYKVSRYLDWIQE
jgi:hypothetical protein